MSITGKNENRIACSTRLLALSDTDVGFTELALASFAWARTARHTAAFDPISYKIIYLVQSGIRSNVDLNFGA